MQTLIILFNFICLFVYHLYSVLWYTAMVGRKSSLKLLRHIMQQYQIPKEQIFETSLLQGVTYRWAIAWTFSAEAAGLYQTYMMLNTTKASDIHVANTQVSHPPIHSTDDMSSPPNDNDNFLAKDDAVLTQGNGEMSNQLASMSATLFQSTMLEIERQASYPDSFSSVLSSSIANLSYQLLARCMQRMTGCLDQISQHLSQQNFQGFESITFMSPLGHINSVQWNVHATYTSRSLLTTNSIGNPSAATIPPTCEVDCRLSILTSTAESVLAPSALSSHAPGYSSMFTAVKSDAFKPLVDLRFRISLTSPRSSQLPSSSSTAMDTDQPDISRHLTADVTQDQEESTVVVFMQLVNSYCAAGLASKLYQRSKEFLEAEMIRTNRKWRRNLQRDTGSGSLPAQPMVQIGDSGMKIH